MTLCDGVEELSTMNDAERLRELARWYRNFAEHAGNPAIWEARLRTAEDFEAEATRLDSAAYRPIENRGAA